MKYIALFLSFVCFSFTARSDEIPHSQVIQKLVLALPVGTYSGKSNSKKSCSVLIQASGTEYSATVTYLSGKHLAFEILNADKVNGHQVYSQEEGWINEATPVLDGPRIRVGSFRGQGISSNTTYSDYGYIQLALWIEREEDGLLVTTGKIDARKAETSGTTLNCKIVR